MIVKLLTEHHLEFLSLKGGCRGSSEFTLDKMSNCWKSRVTAHFITGDTRVFGEDFANITISDFDTNYPASLVLDCGWYGSLNLYAGAFSNMSYIQHLTVST